jgi:adenosine kinase
MTRSTATKPVAAGTILGMGNPLLDITKEVDVSVLEKYGLEANNAILCEDKHLPLYQELVDAGAEFTAGGATQNSIRVAQWMTQTEGATSFIGAVGKDSFAETMVSNAAADGLNVQYLRNDLPTGTCGVLITGKARSLVANLSAANTYKIEHLKAPEQWSVVEKASIYYISGFFLTVSPDSMEAIGEHALKEGKTFACNLSAPFLIEVPPFFEAMKRVLPYTSIYFGNETEAATLAKAMGWETEDVSEIAVRLAQAESKSTRPRTVVFTQGAKPTIIAIADADRVWSVEEYPVISIAADDILDTNGAGDAFVGGFLAGLAAGVSIKRCVARANYAANVVIARSGCTFPAKPTFSD